MAISSKANVGTLQPAYMKRRRLAVTCNASGNGGQSRNTTIHRLIEEQGVLLIPGEYENLLFFVHRTMLQP
jgi:hypothetical protein